MRTLMTTLTYHARERLRERTRLSEDELLKIFREGRTVAFGLNPGGRMQLRLLYSVPDDDFFVMPLDIARDRVCTVLPLAMYSKQRRAIHIPDHHIFDAKSKFIEPLCAVHPLSGQAVRIHATGYFLSGQGQVHAVNLGQHSCPPGITSVLELGDDEVFIGGLLDRLRARGLNPARLDSVYVRQGNRSPVPIPGIGPANPWATVGLFDVPGPVG